VHLGLDAAGQQRIHLTQTKNWGQRCFQAKKFGGKKLLAGLQRKKKFVLRF
jgi:hypothetical protein